MAASDRLLSVYNSLVWYDSNMLSLFFVIINKCIRLDMRILEYRGTMGNKIFHFEKENILLGYCLHYSHTQILAPPLSRGAFLLIVSLILPWLSAE